GLPGVSVAAVNGPAHVVLSGPGPEVAEAVAGLVADGVRVKPLVVSHAFHSPSMEPMVAAFAEVAASVTYSSPRVRFVSAVSGAVAGAEVAEAAYWVRHVLAPVRFDAAMGAL